MDKFYRKGVHGPKHEELYYMMYTACLHGVVSELQTAERVANVLLSNMGVKYKKVSSYAGMEFNFDGTVYAYKKKQDGRSLDCLLFVAKSGDNNVMELMFEVEKGVAQEAMEDIKSIVDTLEW
jgi:hypothetical protein